MNTKMVLVITAILLSVLPVLIYADDLYQEQLKLRMKNNAKYGGSSRSPGEEDAS